ncbi:MAG: twitching motility protein PilT [Actinomycetota bacterium]|jgi:twitching motility protein PilT|nr:twitching motility protein PilT [Actinomycetota bacterium]
MSKPVYEIPVTGDEPGQPAGFPPPARDARPRNLTTAPPPSATGNAPTYPTTPEAPFTSPPPTIAPEGGWPAAQAPVAELPATPGLTPAPEVPPVFSAPMPEGAWAAPDVAPSSTANFPPPAAPQAPPAPAGDLSFPPPGSDASFAPPGAESVSYAEQMFAMDGVSSTLATADPDLIAALSEVLFLNASDLHVAVNTPPMFRVDGSLAPRSVTTPWSRDKVTSALRSILTEKQEERFDEELELDIAYTISANARFRVNMYQQRGAIGAAFRLIPTEIKSLVDLGVPETVAQFAGLPRGLVLVTGPTGSGKSTTLAALIDLVNKTRADHIMTVEDPIEFMHGNQKSLVNQREVGEDTHSFGAALKHVLRQDPDVILIGELRDLETISVALTAAETGHLVFATLHTQDAPQTIDRIIDVFPPHAQGQVRAQLAATLRGVVCQTLVKKASGKGRVVATEVLIATPAVANLIREGKTFQIASAMQAGGDLGMHTMDRHLADLANAGVISQRAAIDKAQDVEGIKQLIHRVDGTADSAGRAMGNSAINYDDAFSGAGR